MLVPWLCLLPLLRPAGALDDSFFGPEDFSGPELPPARLLTPAEQFSEALADARNRSARSPGANMGSRSAGEMSRLLERRGSKGVMIIVENLSGRTLGEPEFFVRCGYQDDLYGGEQSVGPGTIEAFLMHNRKENARSSCGSVSWQVLAGPGKPYRLEDGRGLRLFLTWSSLDTVMWGNNCARGKRNEFVIGFEPVALDISGHGTASWRKKAVYTKYHTPAQVGRVTSRTEGATLTALVDSPGGELQVRAVMGPDCLSWLHVDLVGRGDAELKILAPGEDVYTGDEIWEQMIRQACLDIVATINREKALYGVGLAPLELEPLLQEPIAIDQEMVGYRVVLSMWNITVVGIQDIAFARLDLKRGQGLNSLRAEAVLDMGDLEVRGMYQYTAQCTWYCFVSEFNSEGPQPFSIKMTNATVSVNIDIDTVNGCGRTDSLTLSKIDIPINYSEINFDFTNIGTVLGAAVNLIGSFAIDIGKGLIVDAVKQVVRTHVPSLLCQEAPLNITMMPRLAPGAGSSGAAWEEILEEAQQGWGLAVLRRDRLAEMLVLKVWQDGLAKHFANASSPLAAALDPFQLLPASEDLHQKGVLKAHIVACELFLSGLKDLLLSDIELVRNEDLTYSALRLTVKLPKASLTGKFRLNQVYVLSQIPAKDSNGNIQADITGVQVVLTVVMHTTKAFNQSSNSNIKIDKFEVDFAHQHAKLDVTGLGGKIISKISNKAIQNMGDKVLTMQKETIATEISNIFWGLAKCLMYNPGTDFKQCQDEFWQCLGFPVPFEFPGCPAMYRTADEEIKKFSSYRAYLNDYKAKKAEKAKMVAQGRCLEKP